MPVRLGGTFKMGKTNRKGRAKHDQYVKLHRGVTGSAAWKGLSSNAPSIPSMKKVKIL